MGKFHWVIRWSAGSKIPTSKSPSPKKKKRPKPPTAQAPQQQTAATPLDNLPRQLEILAATRARHKVAVPVVKGVAGKVGQGAD